MKISKKLRTYIGASIAAGTLLVAGVASAGTHVGASVSVSGTRPAAATSAEEHVCTYEQRPVTRRYTDSSGGSYEHKTYETIRVCTHLPEYNAERAPKKVHKEKRPKARKVRRKTRHTNYTVGVSYYDGSPSLHSGVHYGTSTHYRPNYPRHRYYGHNRQHHYGHRRGHHYPHSSFSLSLGFGGLHHGH